jgi:hypothetical protein
VRHELKNQAFKLFTMQMTELFNVQALVLLNTAVAQTVQLANEFAQCGVHCA